MKHEIHVTIPPDQFDKARDLRIKGLRWHLFHNYSKRGTMVDCMSNEQVIGNDAAALEAADARARMLTSLGFDVLRVKIEAEPWRTGAMLYRETHLRVVGGVYARLPSVALLSMQPLTRSWSATLRSEVSREGHDKLLHNTILKLRDCEIFVVQQPITEIVWHDTNRAHDAVWENIT